MLTGPSACIYIPSFVDMFLLLLYYFINLHKSVTVCEFGKQQTHSHIDVNVSFCVMYNAQCSPDSINW